jgi:hypothetical protein
MSRADRVFVSKSAKLTLLGIVVALALGSGIANAYMTSPAAGTADAKVGSLPAPTLATPTTGPGTVTLSWSVVSPAVGSDTVTYYVTRDGGSPAGTCATSASPTPVTSCTDSGLSAGPHAYTVTAVWRSWTATSNEQGVELASGAPPAP